MDFCRCCRTQENWPSRAFCRSLGGLILHLLAYWRSGQHQHQYCHHYHRYQYRHRHHHFPLTVFENVNLLPDDAVVGRRPLCSRITFVESSLRQDILGIVEHHYDDGHRQRQKQNTNSFLNSLITAEDKHISFCWIKSPCLIIETKMKLWKLSVFYQMVLMAA